LDLINKYPHQADLLSDMGMVGNFFGIETLNKKSGVAIGKGLDPSKVKDRLNWLGDRWKDKVNMAAGIIFGLPYDNKEYFAEMKNWILEKNNPLTQIEIYPLVLHKKNMWGHGSEFTLNPEIYGYNVYSHDTGNGIYWDLKSQGLNTNNVTRYANEIMYERLHMNKVSEFQILVQQNLGIPIKEVMKTKYLDLQDKFNMVDRNKTKLDEYKQKIGVL
jgi:hypothetical protein